MLADELQSGGVGGVEKGTAEHHLLCQHRPRVDQQQGVKESKNECL